MPLALHPTIDAIAATRAGDPAALAALYGAHGESVRRVAYRILGDSDEAEEVVQDVFIGLPEALRHYREQGAFGPWLRTLAARTALVRLRATHRRRKAPLSEASSVAVPPDADRLAARLTLAAAIAKLPEALRLVFVLKEMEGHSHAEVAAMLGIRTGTAEVRLHRAMRRLRALLEDRT
ncbi:MAG TPA: sigma-70 family RNA polymerase sigma factor [Gemmatimonadaceae bacterium]|nr:sigma-70 family RNA polymerase sigma factor [Gemmatimonadaceae bacterium]